MGVFGNRRRCQPLGAVWRYPPHDFPSWETVYGYFSKWEKNGVFARLNSPLRQRVRRQDSRTAEPPTGIIDVQSVKISTSVPAAGQGTDAGKKIVGGRWPVRRGHGASAD